MNFVVDVKKICAYGCYRASCLMVIDGKEFHVPIRRDLYQYFKERGVITSQKITANKNK